MIDDDIDRSGYDRDAATELKLYTENDSDLYRQMTTSILRNLATKRARGVYRLDGAVKAFMHLAEAGAKKYTREFDGPGARWHETFSMPTRKAVAAEWAKEFEVEYDLGNYEQLVPKKHAYPVDALKGEIKMKEKGHWVYIVTNPSTGKKSEHTSKVEAMKRAKTRAKRERGEVAVEKACLKPGDMLSYNVKGSGIIWRSDWRSE